MRARVVVDTPLAPAPGEAAAAGGHERGAGAGAHQLGAHDGAKAELPVSCKVEVSNAEGVWTALAIPCFAGTSLKVVCRNWFGSISDI